MAITTIKDQVAQGEDRSVTQWKSKEVVQGLIKSYMENVQVVEDLYGQLLDDRSVFTAVGVQLDVIGTIVGEARAGKADEPYRQAILDRVSLNSADGTPEKVIELLLTITGSDVAHIFEHYPANIHAFVDGAPTNANSKTLEGITPAGVGSRLMFDAGVDSYIGAALVAEQSDLVLENTDNLVLENDDFLEVEDLTEFPIGGRSYFPHLLQTETINPLCGLFDGTVYTVDQGELLLENGGNLVFENGDLMEYQIIEAI